MPPLVLNTTNSARDTFMAAFEGGLHLWACVRACVCACVRACVRACVYVCVHAYIHARVGLRCIVYARFGACMHELASMHACVRACMRVHATFLACMHAWVRMCLLVRARARECVHAWKRTHVRVRVVPTRRASADKCRPLCSACAAQAAHGCVRGWASEPLRASSTVAAGQPLGLKLMATGPSATQINQARGQDQVLYVQRRKDAVHAVAMCRHARAWTSSRTGG